MPEVNIEIKNLPEVFKTLRDIPGGAEMAIRWAIRFALRHGRTVAAKTARERYNIPYGWLLKAIGQPLVSGLSGQLKVSGSKAPLSMFPLRDIYPFGAAIQELKDALPINLLHAFVRGGRVMERVTPDTQRYPIMPMVGLSAPQMIGQRTQVFPELEKTLQADVNTELERLIRLILAGELVPRI